MRQVPVIVIYILLRNSIENMIFSSNKMKMKVQSGQTVEIQTCLVIEMSIQYKNFKMSIEYKNFKAKRGHIKNKYYIWEIWFM